MNKLLVGLIAAAAVVVVLAITVLLSSWMDDE